MPKNGRFLIGLGGVALVVTYLVWTGVSETMIYYLTPSELLARVETDATIHDVGMKVSGRVVEGSYRQGKGELLHHFVVRDLENEQVSFPVEFRDVLPDTFTDEGEVVVEGRFRRDGVFEATLVLTKCGSRYEAAPEDLVG
jgi:cytochrome c-type biogenesis protein CcmE